MYKLVDHDINGTQQFVVTEGYFAGVSFCFDVVQLQPPVGGWDENPDDPGSISYSYIVSGGPDNLTLAEVEASEDFRTLTGDILFDYMNKAFSDGNFEIGKLNNNTQKVEIKNVNK